MSIKHDLLSCPLKGFTSKRKKSFIEREHEIMALAEQIMESDGFSALTMDKVVAGSSCSKGTVYNHFGSKEDLICGLCIKSMREMLVLLLAGRDESCGMGRYHTDDYPIRWPGDLPFLWLGFDAEQ